MTPVMVLAEELPNSSTWHNITHYSLPYTLQEACQMKYSCIVLDTLLERGTWDSNWLQDSIMFRKSPSEISPLGNSHVAIGTNIFPLLRDEDRNYVLPDILHWSVPHAYRKDKNLHWINSAFKMTRRNLESCIHRSSFNTDSPRSADWDSLWAASSVGCWLW